MFKIKTVRNFENVFLDTEVNLYRGHCIVRHRDFQQLNIAFALGPGEVSETKEFLVHNGEMMTFGEDIKVYVFLINCI